MNLLLAKKAIDVVTIGLSAGCMAYESYKLHTEKDKFEDKKSYRKSQALLGGKYAFLGLSLVSLNYVPKLINKMLP